MKNEVHVITFDKPLTEAILVKRKNRFIVEVLINNELIDCHIPTTGRVGNIALENLPCLLSVSDNINRKTNYTVEAIAITKDKTWLGINQNKMNDIVDVCIRRNLFSEMITKNHIKREQVLGDSRIDFLIDNTYLEVKMPLISLVLSDEKRNTFNSVERLLKQMNQLSEVACSGKGAILLTCFMYEREGFLPGVYSTRREEVLHSIDNAKQNGVQFWIANFRIDKKGVYLLNYNKK